MPKMPTQQSFKYQVQQTVKPRLTPLGLAIGGALTAGSLQAATITVTTLQDGNVPGECSLRSAIYASNNNAVVDSCIAGDAGEDEIVFDEALNGSINLVPGTGSVYDGTTLPVTEAVSIDGNNRITVQGAGNAPVIFSKYNGGYNEGLTLSGLTVTGGGGSRGGGILSTASSLEIRSSTITGNSATDAGAGIFQQHEGSGFVYFLIRDSEISNNVTSGAAGVGGGIYTTDYLQLRNSDLLNNQATLHGGAIARYGYRSLNMSRTDFIGNSAVTGNGGAIYSYNNVGQGASFISDLDSFVDNIAGGDGGAISITDNGVGNAQASFAGRITIRGTRFETNSASGQGGALYISKADRLGPLDSEANQVRVIANPTSGARTVFQGNTASGYGGGLFLSLGENTVTTLSDTNFIGNISESDNGGGAFIDTGNGGFNLSRTVFAQNASSLSGGGLYASIADGGDFQASRISFEGNSAVTSAGGALVNTSGGDIGLEAAEFRSNNSAGYGGGLQISGTPNQVSIGYSVFNGNVAGEGGGGLDFFAPTVSTGIFEIKYSEFSNNTSNTYGGGMSLIAGAGSFIVENSTISGNDSGTTGGGIYASDGAELQLKYTTVAENYASDEGGGLFTYLTGSCQIDNTLLAGNTATAASENQDLRINDTSSPCNVNHSLVAGNYSEFTNGTGNVLYQDPLLAPLADNGGAGGRTHALLEGSPAIDAGNVAKTIPDFDQRGAGFLREFGSGLDIGAYERQPIFDTIFNDRFETP